MEPLTNAQLDQLKKESLTSLPSRAVDEILYLREENKRLDEKVREMQGHSTKRLGDLRMWRARALHAKELLTSVLVDFPLVSRLSKDEDANVEAVLKRTQRVWERVELLEKDIWCGAADVAREFVKQVDYELRLVEKNDNTDGRSLNAFIRVWRAKFVQVVGE